MTGDFDGDKKTDLALVSGNGWRSVPLALSNGNGTFRITNPDVGDFGGRAQITGNKAVIARDFTGDGRTDLAIAGDASWGTIPVAFSSDSWSKGECPLSPAPSRRARHADRVDGPSRRRDQNACPSANDTTVMLVS